MSRYIDRDEPLGEINRHKFDTDADYEFAWNALTSAETADVAPVVLCENCIYSEDCNRFLSISHRDYVLEQNVTEYKLLYFCSYGKEKEALEDTANV